MTMESLMRAAEAAGFATASDENETAPELVAGRQLSQSKGKLPKDVLTFAVAGSSTPESLGLWARSQFANLLPVRYSKA